MIVKKNAVYIVVFIAAILVFCIFPLELNKFEFPTYRVILDPGHGGVCKSPKEQHGDRYDPITGKYLDVFREGASYHGLQEHKIVFRIAKKAEQYLALCAPGGDNAAFYEILKQYSDEEPERINIITYISRKRSLTEDEEDQLEDPNADYRLFDYPSKNGIIQQGRISKMNALKPHLIVSIHLAEYGPRDYHGISPVISAPYRMLYYGLQYLQGNHEIKSKIDAKMLDEWFCESNGRNNFQWFLNDVSLYFTGFPLEKDLGVSNDFKGYRYNMVSWRYKDFDGWEYIAKYHPVKTRYAKKISDFVPDGKFWNRERLVYEQYRRDGGIEGFGGDNAYTSYEIIRYILYTLYIRSGRSIHQQMGKSYSNVWIIPLHVNAINTYIELGYLNRRKDRDILTLHQDEIARGIAVGIYSLFAGIKVKNDGFPNMPRGKRIDLQKYKMINEKTYFDDVIE